MNKKEIATIILVSIILALTISLVKSVNAFLYTLLAIFIVIIGNVLAKKIVSHIVDSEIEIKLWEVNRFGFKAHQHLKKPFPAGAFFPLIVTAITAGYVYWMACLTFDVKPKIYRTAKRWGLYSFSEMTEWHIGIIAASGVFINLLMAFAGYLLGFSDFARYNIYFAAFSMLPLSDLDGNKIFFGSIVMWSFLAALALIALGYAFLLV
ncbi:hypothetical protein HYT23_02680 [Candidatus Pacearchaeota archaeon]|nr:hypothetical protein [Candidatus Pacearchaeota archaeon]